MKLMSNETFESLAGYLPYSDADTLIRKIEETAEKIVRNNLENEKTYLELCYILISNIINHAQELKNQESLLEFDDPIVSIEHLEEQELIDITVSGDNLFYANEILTKNSIGIPATADFMISISRTEELDQLSQLMFKQIKNRYGKKTQYLRFLVGVDLETQTLFDVSMPTRDMTPDVNDEEIIRSSKNVKERFKALNSFN